MKNAAVSNGCCVSFVVLCSVFGWFAGLAAAQGVGYSDTPKLPGQPWRVHDIDRPNPPVVDPGPVVPCVPVPPSDAIVLFDGTNLDAWQMEDGSDAKWILKDDGSMQVKPGSGTLMTKAAFGDMQLHIEWATPTPPVGESQHRGNSGVFLMGRYEIQILDSFENKTYADGQAAAMYGQHPPLVNASRGPGQWQTYDIVFEAPRFTSEGELVRPAYVTVFHNGVLVQNHQSFIGATVHRAVATYHPDSFEDPTHPVGPIKLQDHGNPMRFRNIWVRPLHAAESDETRAAQEKQRGDDEDEMDDHHDE